MAIENNLKTADIILLLISPDFMESDYCYNEELQRALERHHKEQVCVIPIIVRPTHWKSTPIGSLQALPKNGEPISTWKSGDLAYFNIADEIEKTIMALGRFQPTTSLSRTHSWSSDSLSKSNPSAQKMSILTNADMNQVETEVAIREARAALSSWEKRNTAQYLAICGAWRKKAETARKVGDWTQEIRCWTILLGFTPYAILAKERLWIAEQNRQYALIYEEAKRFYRAEDKNATKQKLLELWQKAPFYGDPNNLARHAGFRIFVPLGGWRKVIWSTLLLSGIALSIGPVIAIILAACGVSFRQDVSNFFVILCVLALIALLSFEYLNSKWILLKLASTRASTAQTRRSTTHSPRLNAPRK